MNVAQVFDNVRKLSKSEEVDAPSASDHQLKVDHLPDGIFLSQNVFKAVCCHFSDKLTKNLAHNYFDLFYSINLIEATLHFCLLGKTLSEPAILAGTD